MAVILFPLVFIGGVFYIYFESTGMWHSGPEKSHNQTVCLYTDICKMKQCANKGITVFS